jgi:hypothetical protein
MNKHLRITLQQRTMMNKRHNGKRPTLGDKVDLFQEKGDKSITLTCCKAIAVPVYFKTAFFKKNVQQRGFHSHLISWVQISFGTIFCTFRIISSILIAKKIFII